MTLNKKVNEEPESLYSTADGFGHGRGTVVQDLGFPKSYLPLTWSYDLGSITLC